MFKRDPFLMKLKIMKYLVNLITILINFSNLIVKKN